MTIAKEIAMRKEIEEKQMQMKGRQQIIQRNGTMYIRLNEIYNPDNEEWLNRKCAKIDKNET